MSSKSSIYDKITDCFYGYDHKKENYFKLKETKRHKYVSKEKRKSKPFLTIYEFSLILSTRSSQISKGSKPLVEVKKGDKHSAFTLAFLELETGLTPYKVVRPMPDETRELWDVDELENLHDFTLDDYQILA